MKNIRTYTITALVTLSTIFMSVSFAGGIPTPANLGYDSLVTAANSQNLSFNIFDVVEDPTRTDIHFHTIKDTINIETAYGLFEEDVASDGWIRNWQRTTDDGRLIFDYSQGLRSLRIELSQQGNHAYHFFYAY